MYWLCSFKWTNAMLATCFFFDYNKGHFHHGHCHSGYYKYQWRSVPVMKCNPVHLLKCSVQDFHPITIMTFTFFNHNHILTRNLHFYSNMYFWVLFYNTALFSSYNSWQWASKYNTRTLKLHQLNGVLPSSIVLLTSVFFLTETCQMSLGKKKKKKRHVYVLTNWITQNKGTILSQKQPKGSLSPEIIV